MPDSQAHYKSLREFMRQTAGDFRQSATTEQEQRQPLAVISAEAQPRATHTVS
jgi:hypothetical protein